MSCWTDIDMCVDGVCIVFYILHVLLDRYRHVCSRCVYCISYMFCWTDIDMCVAGVCIVYLTCLVEHI